MTDNQSNKATMLPLVDHKLRSILSSPEICGLCLDGTYCSSSTDVLFEIIIHGNVYRRHFKDIIRDMFQDAPYLPASTNICKQCTDKTLEFYVFMHSVKETAKVLDCYVNCLYNKIVSIDEKLDPIQHNGDKKCSIILCSRYRRRHGVKVQKTMKVNGVNKENIANVGVDVTNESVSTVLEDEHIKLNDSSEDGKNRRKTDYSLDYDFIKDEFEARVENNSSNIEKIDSDIDNDILEAEVETKSKQKFKRNGKKIKRLNKSAKKVIGKRKLIKKENETSLEERNMKHIEGTDDSDGKLCKNCLKHFSNEQFNDHTCRFRCPVCPKKLCLHEKYLNSYRDQIVNQAESIECPECEYICDKKKDDLIDHANKEHLNHRPYSCSVCTEKFFSSSDYTKHKSSHNIEKKYTCKLCNIEFADRTKLASHNRKHKRLQQDKIKCSVCSKEILESTLNMHMKLHDGAESHSFTCETCGKSFAFKVRLDQHKMTHSDPIPCTICGQLIKPMSMYLHLRRHKIKLNPALKRKPTKKPHNKKCDYCEYMTYCKDLLEIHINKEHLKVKPHVCSVCGASYMSKYYLNQHMKVHTEEKKFNCPVCNKSLRHKVGLKKHMMLHTGEQPHICRECGEGYKTVTMLKYHMQKHKGKNEQCPLCGGMYYSIKHVRSHIKKCHWEFKDRKFDYKQIRGLTKEHYHIFQDRRKALADDIYDDD